MSHLSLSTQGPQRNQNFASSVTSPEESQLSAYFIQTRSEIRRNMGKSWIERWTTQSSVNSYSDKVCHAISAFMELLKVLHHHRRGLHLEKTDYVLPCGRQAGIWRMLPTYNPSLLQPMLYFGAATLKGRERKRLPFLSFIRSGYTDVFTPTLTIP